MSAPSRPAPYDAPPPSPRRHSGSVALYLIFSILTLGLFNLYWNWRQMRSCNELLGRRDFSWILWILFCLLTFGLYHFYYQYKMGAALVEIEQRFGMSHTKDLPILSVILTVVGFGIVTDCVHQHELNRVDAFLAEGGGL